MKTIDEIYNIVEESSHETAFNREEVDALHKYLQEVPEEGIVVEIGVEFGRSTSVIAEVQKERNYIFYAVDPFNVQDNGEEAKNHVLNQIKKHNWDFNLWLKSSERGSIELNKDVDFLHIDGNHDYKAVLLDCTLWLPKLKSGGYVCFDDYGHDSLPGVFKAVKKYMSKHNDFEFIGRFGNKLGVFRKK